MVAAVATLDPEIAANHGGRQLDGSQAALDALPSVAAAVNGRVPIIMDSGIRRGSNVNKPLLETTEGAVL
jgi:isopentenyl diphosphate isomerase/L-lactate dehydrogenase-like FMN-dependent dehydrogenase